MYFLSEALEFYIPAIGFGFLIGLILFIFKKIFSF